MQPRRFQVLAAAVGLLMLATAHAAVAREVKYPPKEPAFTFQLPEGWNLQDKGGVADALYCSAKDGSGLNVQFYNVSNEELGGEYQKFAETALKIGKVKDIEVVKADEKTLKNGQTVKFVRSTFKDPTGTPYVSLIVFVPMGADHTCAIHCFLPEKQLDSHKDQIEELLNTIKPVD